MILKELWFYLAPVTFVGATFGPVLLVLGWVVLRLRKSRSWLPEVLAVPLGLAWIATLFFGCILVPSMIKAQWEARMTLARINLMQIGLSLKFYAEDNNGEWPPVDAWALALTTSRRGCSKRMFFLPVPLGSGDVSQFPETDYVYTGRVREIPPDVDISADGMLLWTRRPIKIPATGETPYRKIRLILASDYRPRTISEEQFQRIVQSSEKPRGVSDAAAEQVE